jgi:putative heme iron utilization protein
MSVDPGARAAAARQLVRHHRSGVLSSHSVKFPGFPYGSALPHATDHAGRPVVLISHLAEHTHNVEADARASFIVCGSGPDLQAEPRVTLLGEARPTSDQRVAARYLRLYPDHQQYLQIGGFRFFVVEPVQVRYIQGFGGLHWIPGESYLAAASLADAEDSILKHMNADHGDALRDYCRHVHAVDAPDAEMVGIDCDGFDVSAGGNLLRFDFDAPLTNAGEVRNALVALAQQARAPGQT